MSLSCVDFFRSVRANHLRISVYRDGRVRVTIPRHTTQVAAEIFVEAKKSWIERALAKMQRQTVERLPAYSARELPERKREALACIRERLEYFAGVYGVTYHRVTIKQLTTRWGSCSIRGNLNFHVQLLRLPERLVDYLLVHELCHLREMNHSARFWALVAKTIPDYRACRHELRRNYALR